MEVCCDGVVGEDVVVGAGVEECTMEVCCDVVVGEDVVGAEA